MNNDYLLPCECGQNISVGLTQAGQTVTCACGRSLKVPTMSQLRKLKSVQSDRAASKNTTRKWSGVQGAIFGIGAVVAAIGLLVAGICGLYRTALHPEIPAVDTDQAWNERIDQLFPEQTWDMWLSLEDKELEQPHPPPYILHQRYSEHLLTYVYGGLAAAAVGLVTSGLSLVIRR